MVIFKQLSITISQIISTVDYAVDFFIDQCYQNFIIFMVKIQSLPSFGD